MSRSSFADRFRSLVGTPPLDHLLHLRMHVAGRELRRTNATVSAIGAASGYTSDAAFSNAFKRVMGTSPSAWRSQDDRAAPFADDTDAAKPPPTPPGARRGARAKDVQRHVHHVPVRP
jgi:AraC-like DNA-binding protein